MREVCKPGGAGDRDRRRGIPFVLAAGVHVDVGRCPARPPRLWLPPIPSRPACRPARRGPRARWPAGGCATPRSAGVAGRGEVAGDVGRGQRNALRGKGDRARDELAGLPQRDVHGPVVAAEFGELAGAVERVDDPHPLGAAAGPGCRRPPRTAPRRRAARRPAPPSGSHGTACPPRPFARLHWRRRARRARRAAARRPRWPAARRPRGHCGRSSLRGFQQLDDQLGEFVGRAVRGEPQVGVLRPLIRAVDAGEVGDLTRSRLGVQAPSGSRRSQSSSGVSQNTSKKSSPASVATRRASSRCSSSGLIAGTSTTWPESASRVATWASLRRFSARSAMENPGRR